MRALTAFQIFMGSGEWFDLSKRPIERASFEFGTDEDAETEIRKEGYVINDKCIGCGSCMSVCPAGAVERR
jgi:ferredoxin